MTYTILQSIGIANPPFELPQTQFLKFLAQLETISPKVYARAVQIYENSAIDRRFTCIADYLTTPENFNFYPPNHELEPAPTTSDRNRIYQIYAPKIAQSAAQSALDKSSFHGQQITHLIVVSCTGFFAPGIDVSLIKSLGLSPTIDRVMIGFMGCFGAFNGFKTAHAICQSNAQAKVLLVCVELCTLHFQSTNTLENVIINALFGDGAAAAVFSNAAKATGKLAYIHGSSLLAPDSEDLMSWQIGDTGFLMGLSAKVPKTIVDYLPQYLGQWQDLIDLKTIDCWAVHPGGRQILDQIQQLLNLPDRVLAPSYQVLRHYGNMSSGTILFVLQEALRRGHSNLLALAFGPGLTIEGCLFQEVKG